MKEINIKNELNYFNDIHANSKKYSLSWAFRDAQNRANDTFDNLCCADNNNISCSKFKEAMENGEQFSKIEQSMFKFTRNSKWLARIFNNMQHILSFFEILISVGLVMLISNLSHHSEAMIENEWLSLCVIVLFAFLKVFIERLVITPRFERWGWKAYASSFNRLYATLAYAMDQEIEVVPAKVAKVSTLTAEQDFNSVTA